MGFHVDNPEFDRLVAEVARMAGETEMDVLFRALEEHRNRLQQQHRESKAARVRRVLEEEVWPLVPPEVQGRAVTKAEREEVLGYGSDGV